MSRDEAEVLAERARKMLADVGVDPSRVQVVPPASGEEGCDTCRRVVFMNGGRDKEAAKMFWRAGRLLHEECIEECFECWWTRRAGILSFLLDEIDKCPDHMS